MELLDELNEYLRLVWSLTKVLILLELFYNSPTIVRHTQIDSGTKKGVVFSWSNSIVMIPFTEGQTITFTRGTSCFYCLGLLELFEGLY